MQQDVLSRREREKLRQRRDMLDGALALFSKKGYHQVSMQQIAQKSEFAIGTLYKFFKSKEDLYQTLILEFSDQCHNTIRTAMDQHQGVVEKLEAYVWAIGQIFKENAALIRLYFTYTRRPGFNIQVDLDLKIRQQNDRLLAQLTDIFNTGMEKGHFSRIADPYCLAVSLESIVMGHILLWLEGPDAHSFPEAPGKILDILFKGLVQSREINGHSYR
jgi:AcrR family transcriptional regulator